LAVSRDKTLVTEGPSLPAGPTSNPAGSEVTLGLHPYPGRRHAAVNLAGA
jgi:hypothetical protein